LRALILTPTRELAIQVKNHIVAIAKYTGIQVNFSFYNYASTITSK
jgi:superfamily II DNA/RNA helicase